MLKRLKFYRACGIINFEPKSGEWKYEDGALIGIENRNKGGILFTRDYYNGNIMLSFTASTILPATRDLNCRYENKAGLDRNIGCGVGSNPYSTTSLYNTPSRRLHLLFTYPSQLFTFRANNL